ncbi:MULTISPECIES: hypothetical protein [unclassified Lentimicrobium]|nr:MULTISPECIES: hypothetical protein [unclassified Lentimicrobium]
MINCESNGEFALNSFIFEYSDSKNNTIVTRSLGNSHKMAFKGGD